jgi:uncharacterized membrane protein
MVMNGSLPYWDFPLEYPPFALFFLVFPRLFTSSFPVYTILFQIEVFVFDMIAVYLIYLMAEKRNIAPWKMLAVYTAAILAIGPIFVNSYDIFPTVLVLLSLYFFQRGNNKTSWAVLALGVMTKIYPIVIAPIFFLYLMRERRYKSIWEGLVSFAAVFLISILPFLILRAGSLASLLSFHTGRPLEIESTYSSILLFIGRLTMTPPAIVFSAGSNGLGGPAADILSNISIFLLELLLLVSYWLIYRRIKTEKYHFEELAAFSLLVIAVTLIASKVLSPQYMIWPMPLIPLLTNNKRYIISALFIIVAVMTYYVYPLHYAELGDIRSPVVIVLFVRNILLILLTILLAVFLFRMKPLRVKMETEVISDGKH